MKGEEEGGEEERRGIERGRRGGKGENRKGKRKERMEGRGRRGKDRVERRGKEEMKYLMSIRPIRRGTKNSIDIEMVVIPGD